MDYKVVYSKSAEFDLSRLDLPVATRILKKIKFFAGQNNPLLFAKRLQGVEEPHYRFRIGDYRAIFRLDSRTDSLVLLVIIKIAHRREVYE